MRLGVILDRTDGVSFESRLALQSAQLEYRTLIRSTSRRALRDSPAGQTAELLAVLDVARRGRGGRLGQPAMAAAPKLSVVIPSTTKRRIADPCSRGCYPALDALALSYEIVFVTTAARIARRLAAATVLLEAEPREWCVSCQLRPHSAVMAGLAYCAGGIRRYLGCDLQNPPEEIGKLVGMLDQGYDYVGTIQPATSGLRWRRWFSKRIK